MMDWLAGRFFPEGLDVKVTFIAMIMMIEIRCKLSRLMLVTMAICKKLRNRLTSNKATACIGNHCLVHRVEMVHLQASGYFRLRGVFTITLACEPSRPQG